MTSLLNTEQQKAYNLILTGENVFITGPSGTGKSHIINIIRTLLSHKKIGITSTTGISALLIGGTTLHSYLGIGLGKDDVKTTIKKMSSKCIKRWKELELLILDEVSMLSPNLFDKLEEIGRFLRNNNFPFGGIQLILTGDFLQLPVVNEDKYCFEAKTWNSCIKNTIILKEIMRQTDKKFQEVLNNLRYGIVTDDCKQLLDSRIRVKLENKSGIKPTRIYTTNMNVDIMNEKELQKLSNVEKTIYEYEMDINIPNPKNKILEDKFKKNCLAPFNLKICKGAQVMLLINLDLDSGLANGSRGVVIDFYNDLPLVKFLNGEERIINSYTWEIFEEKEIFCSITQLPLKLAWAVTVHKCVVGDTIIYTEESIKRIRDLVFPDQKFNQIREIEIDIYGDKGFNLSTQIYKGDIEDTIEIITKNGYLIEGSYRHPVLTENGWKKLPEIKIGDKIKLRKGTNIYNEKNIIVNSLKIDEDMSYLFGILYMKAYIDDKNIEIICKNNIDTIIQSFKKNFGKTFKIYHIEDQEVFRLSLKDREIVNFLSKCGIKNNEVPWTILENNKKSQEAFIKAVIDCCDSKQVIKSYKKRFLKDLQVLLLNMGISSKREDYNLTLEKIEGPKDFYEEVAIIEKGKNYVYDIYIPSDNTFLGNGIVNHNSQGATLDFAEVDLDRVFEYGQAYVALSRVKNKEGLSILNISYDSIKANPKAVDYYTKDEKINFSG